MPPAGFSRRRRGHQRSFYWIKEDEPLICPLICRAAFALSAASFLVTAQGANAGGLPGLKPGHYLEQGVDCAKPQPHQVVTVSSKGVSSIAATCEFRRINRAGAVTFVVEQSCLRAGDAKSKAIMLATPMLVMPGGEGLQIKRKTGQVDELRRCDPQSMPEPWRSQKVQ